MQGSVNADALRSLRSFLDLPPMPVVVNKVGLPAYAGIMKLCSRRTPSYIISHGHYAQHERTPHEPWSKKTACNYTGMI